MTKVIPVRMVGGPFDGLEADIEPCPCHGRAPVALIVRGVLDTGRIPANPREIYRHDPGGDREPVLAGVHDEATETRVPALT